MRKNDYISFIIKNNKKYETTNYNIRRGNLRRL